MSAKLKLNPNVAYFLGLYAYSKGKPVGVASNNPEAIQRFTKIAMDEFEIEPNKILFDEKEGTQVAYFYNSKLKKLLERALRRKDVTFKYKNAYSASYLAGIYDVKGGKEPKGFIFFRDMDKSDSILIERLGWHTKKSGYRTYVVNEKKQEKFEDFIKVVK